MRIELPDLTTYEGDPQEVALVAAVALEAALTELTGFAQEAERQVVNGAMQDAVEVYHVPSPYEYAQGTREVSLIARSNGALGLAARLAGNLRAVLETPLLDRE